MSNFKTELGKAETMEQFLKICGEYYDFKNCKLGPITKFTLISNIDKVIAASGAKQIKK